MKRALLNVFGGLAVMAAAFAPSDAGASTLPGVAGRAWVGSEASCFTSASFSSGITNTCSGSRSWFVSLPLSVTGAHTFRASSTWTSPMCGPNPCIPTQPFPSCRFVVRDAANVELRVGSATSISGQNVSLGSFSTTTGSVAHIDCALPQNNYPLSQVRWTF